MSKAEKKEYEVFNKCNLPASLLLILMVSLNGILGFCLYGVPGRVLIVFMLISGILISEIVAFLYGKEMSLLYLSELDDESRLRLIVSLVYFVLLMAIQVLMYVI